jgi:O-antigen/teichoic acid export membrane protein
MKIMTGKIPASAYYSRLLEWGRLVSITGLAQVLIQGLGLLSGILIIRLLPTKEYALYTLANAMLATITVLADSGIGAGVLAHGGRVWQYRDQLGKVLVTGIQLRKKFALLTLLIALPILVYLLIHHGSGWIIAGCIAVSLIPAFYAALSDTLLEIPLKLHQDITALQRNQILANLSRFVLLSSGLFFLPYTFIAMLAGGVTRIWANMKLRKLAGKFADLSQPQDLTAKGEITEMLKRTMPSTIYYCASGQITIWLISIFGNTTAIAQIGALERIVGALSLITVLFSTLVIPRFARLPQEPGILLLRFVQILILLFLISGAVCTLFYFFPAQVLFILGKNYAHLSRELLLVAISGCISLMAGIANYLSVARGWALPPVLHISVSLAIQIALICLMDLSSLTNVLILSIINAAMALILYSAYFFYKGSRAKRI